jgi:putative oxidoreductase
MKNTTDAGLLLLRAGVSVLMMTHGYAKLEKLLAGGEIDFFNFMGMGPEISLVLTVIGELLAPAMIALGLFTRIAAIPAAFTMAVAAFWIHRDDGLSDQEHSLLYFISFTAVLLLGPGKYSIDSRKGKS